MNHIYIPHGIYCVFHYLSYDYESVEFTINNQTMFKLIKTIGDKLTHKNTYSL